jgi:hypothetical protein
LRDLGVISGVGDNLFDPGGDVTRGQFTKMCVLAFGLADSSAKADFPDVPPGHWAYNSVASAYTLGIVNGRDGAFGTDDNITRQEMAAVAYRTLNTTGKALRDINASKTFSDESEIDGYAREAVSALASGNVINGYGDGRFDPAGTATRAQAAKIVFALLSAAQ